VVGLSGDRRAICSGTGLGPAGAVRWAPTTLLNYLGETILNRQARRPAGRNARRHYDLDTDIFEATLDKRLIYTCGLWDGARDLDEAQEHKLDLVCRKLGLREGMSLLDIGCGWGGFARFAAERYGCRVTGVTVSGIQADYATSHCRGLPIEIVLQDYREIRGRFDRVSCIGMLEHVGPKNYRTFMKTVRRALHEDGLFLLHFFATQRSWPNTLDGEVLWIKKHIFPGMVVPSMKQVGAAIEGQFVVEDLQNIGADYGPTLLAWFAKFDREWPRLRRKYGERFYRMWKYYLLSCAGAFRARKYQVWQFVLSPRGVAGGYRRPGTTVMPEVVALRETLEPAL
jgi:cyclopropane-fatty-acyl-phospholipid synthase